MKSEFLDGVAWDAERGRLLYRDIRYMVIRPETLVELQKAVERVFPDEAERMVAAGGFAGGSKSARRYREALGLGPEATAKFLCGMGGQIGWGHFELLRFDAAARELEIQVRSSPFAEAYGRAARPVCHFIRGVAEGLSEVVFGPGGVAVETSCAATGDPLCRFAVRRRA